MVEGNIPNTDFTDPEWEWGKKWLLAQLSPDPNIIPDYQQLGDSMVAAIQKRREVLGLVGTSAADLQVFIKGTLPYFHSWVQYKENYQGKDPEVPSHPDQMARVGKGYKQIRHNCNLKREEAALILGVDQYFLAAFEAGWIPPASLPAGFVQNLSSLLEYELEHSNPKQ